MPDADEVQTEDSVAAAIEATTQHEQLAQLLKQKQLLHATREMEGVRAVAALQEQASALRRDIAAQQLQREVDALQRTRQLLHEMKEAKDMKKAAREEKRLRRELARLCRLRRCIADHAALNDADVLRFDISDPADASKGYGAQETFEEYVLQQDAGPMRGVVSDEECTCVGELQLCRRALPFARGRFKVAHYARVTSAHTRVNTINVPLTASESQLCVVKLPIGAKGKKALMKDVKACAVASALAHAFNDAVTNTPHAVRLHFVWTRLLKQLHNNNNNNDDDDDGGSVTACCGVASKAGAWLQLEPYIPGEWKKWTNNCDKMMDDADVAEAFSHFTFDYTSRHRETYCEPLLVSDIQGSVSEVGGSTVYTLTDPAVHSLSGHGFGATNLGRHGLTAFFEQHECKQLCAALSLTKVDASAVATHASQLYLQQQCGNA